MFILPGFIAAWFGWIVLRAITQGEVTARSITTQRRKEPFWFWLTVSFYALVALVSVYATLVLLWPGPFPH